MNIKNIITTFYQSIYPTPPEAENTKSIVFYFIDTNKQIIYFFDIFFIYRTKKAKQRIQRNIYLIQYDQDKILNTRKIQRKTMIKIDWYTQFIDDILSKSLLTKNDVYSTEKHISWNQEKEKIISIFKQIYDIRPELQQQYNVDFDVVYIPKID